MSEKVIMKLTGVSSTLLLTLNARARESQRADRMIQDDLAVKMVNQIDCDFSRLKLHRYDEIAVMMRMRKFDSQVRTFLESHPNAVVVHIGCGLDTRFERVDNGQVEWFDLDMPDVIDLRKKLLHVENARCHMLACSVFDDAWVQELIQLKPRSFFFLAEGVFPYFEEKQVRSIFLTIRDQFPGAELICDAHAPFVLWADNLQLAISGVTARLQWSIKDGREPQRWGDDIQLLDEWNYYEDDEPRLKAFRWVRNIPFITKSSGVYHYKLG